MRRHSLFILLLALPFWTGATNAAQESLKAAQFDKYIDRLDKKFDRAAVNTVGGWTQMIYQPLEAVKKSEGKKSKTMAALKGTGKGITYAVADTLGGFLNFVTSLVPRWELPLPEGGTTVKIITGAEPR